MTNKETKIIETSFKNANSFSLEELNRIGNNDKEFTIKMLEKFLSSVSECSESMQSAISQNDWSKIKTTAHKSIPSYSLMGLKTLARDLISIESYAGKNEYKDELQNLVKEIEIRNEELIHDIKKHLQELKQGKEDEKYTNT